jgi:hypothetical protein
MPAPNPKLDTQKSHPNALISTSLNIAADPETPPAILSRMARTSIGDELLTEALALNPNTPLSDLFELWSLTPLCALDNPIVAFQTFHNGKLLHEILPGCVQHKLYVALRSNKRDDELEIHLPVEARLKWFTGPEPDTGYFYRCPMHLYNEVARGKAGHEQRERENAFALTFFEYVARDPSPAVRKEMVARVPTISLRAYREETIAEIRLLWARRVAEDHGGRGEAEQAVVETLREELARDADEAIRCCIAGGSALENPVFERLAADSSLNVREQLAKRKTTNQTWRCEEAWKALSQTNTEIARLVALNDACPFQLCFQLIEHADVEVRKNAWSVLSFRNRKKRRLLLQRVEQLLRHKSRHPELRTIAANKTIPPKLATRFAHSTDILARVVASNPQLLEKERKRLVSSHDDKTARAALALATENEILWQALQHPSPAVRAGLAKKRGAHAARIRFLLARDKSLDVRRFLITHLIDAKDLDETESALVRPQIELVLSSASPVEKRGLLHCRALRKQLIQWNYQDAIARATPR